jgi:4-deoxy-L-threo-5-hexosulose-uronate ketol-isomerase
MTSRHLTKEHMHQRYATDPSQIPGMTTADLRRRFLVEDLFVQDELNLVYTHHDRIVLGGAVPGSADLELESPPELASAYFLENRELAIVNVGRAGTVVVDGVTFELGRGACLYLGRGVRQVLFAAGQSEDGPRYFLFSAPAHTTYPNALIEPDDGTVRELGDPLTSNCRTLRQYIHQDGVRSCQIVVGVTQLHAGSMWNTMPAHTHDRRTECYLYFDVPADARVVHLLGERVETRHLIVGNEEAVISPSWSLHSGVGTAAYSFVWAMAGENQAFDDMDPAPIEDLA